MTGENRVSYPYYESSAQTSLDRARDQGPAPQDHALTGIGYAVLALAAATAELAGNVRRIETFVREIKEEADAED